jgi:hypothetical protein
MNILKIPEQKREQLMRFKKLCLFFAISTLYFSFAYAIKRYMEEGFHNLPTKSQQTRTFL